MLVNEQALRAACHVVSTSWPLSGDQIYRLYKEVESNLAPSPRAQALEEGFRKGLEAACGVVDAHSEYDRQLCCDGRECGCYGSTVHQSMQHYIRALSSHPVSSDMGVERPVEGGCRYRILEDGETIEATDEYLEDDAVTWTRLNKDWSVGGNYHRIFKPMRRPLPQAPGVAV